MDGLMPRLIGRVCVCRVVLVAAIVSAAGAGGTASFADTVTVGASKDTSIFENDLPLSNGAGDGIFSGRTGPRGGNMVDRGLVAFDLSGIPAGSTVTSAALTLTLLRGSPIDGDQTYTINRLTAEWGEGASVAFGGTGNFAEPGDATWAERIFPGTPWTTPGGDFMGTASASQTVGIGFGPVTWGSTAAMVADVQGWVNDAASNFGWIIRGNEEMIMTARQFASRENTMEGVIPSLTVEYTPPTPPCAGDWNMDHMLNSQDFFDFLTDFFGFDADFNHDGMTNSQDYFDFVTAFFTGC